MKKWLIICLLAELVSSVVIFLGSCFLQSETVKAYSAWYQNPTEENRKEFDHQKRISALEQIGFGVAIYSVMAGLTIFLFQVVAKGQKKFNFHETPR